MIDEKGKFKFKGMCKRIFEKVKRLEQQDIRLPERSTKNSAGYDFFAIEDVICKPHEVTMIGTGIKVRMENDEFLGLHARSSLGIKKQLILVNSVGIVDSDYYENENNDGEIAFPYYNLSDEAVAFSVGDKIGQGIFQKYLKVDGDNVTKTRNGGFGSTGN